MANVAKKLTKNLKNLILLGVQRAGRYNTEEVLSHVEERMSFTESVTAEKFLNWAAENKKTFGHGNIDAVYAEFVKTR